MLKGKVRIRVRVKVKFMVRVRDTRASSYILLHRDTRASSYFDRFFAVRFRRWGVVPAGMFKYESLHSTGADIV